MKMPKQCDDCIWLKVCSEEKCLKEKPCASKVKAEPYDDLLDEMIERAGQ